MTHDSLRARGLAFAQRMADASKAAAETYVEPEPVDDEDLVEPPDWRVTHDRDGWPEPRLINGHYRVEPQGAERTALEQARLSLKGAGGLALDCDEPDLDMEFARSIGRIDAALASGPPYADLEQRVPEAWTEPEPSFRRGLLFGCGTELAAVLLILALAFLLGHVATLPPYTGGSNETTRFPGLAGRTRDALGASSAVPTGASGSRTERSDGGAPLGVVPGIGAGDALDQSAVAPVPAPVSLVEPPLASLVDTLRGVASWYAYRPGEAAAGPRLRAWLGPRWRGQRVTVSGPAGSRVLRLTDFMRADRLVDLASANFPAICGPLSMGVCRVSIAVGGRPVPTAPIPTAPATDVQ